MRYLLKVFSGPHVGAEVVLAEGESIIGSSDECDLVLNDRLIAARHAAITIQDDRITCRPLDDAVVLVDGQPIDETVLRPFQFFTIGNTHLAVGPADKLWPQFDLSDFQLRVPEEPEQDEPSSTPEEDSADHTPVTSRRTGHHEAAAPKQRRRIPVKIVAGAAIIGLNAVIAIVGVSFGWSGGGDARAEAEEIASEIAEFDRLRTELAQSAPRVDVEHVNGRVCVTGYVATEHEKDALLQTVRETHPHGIVTVWSTESLLNSVQERVEQDGWKALSVANSTEPGVVRITGQLAKDAATRQRWQATVERIEEDVPLKELVMELSVPPEPTQVADAEVAPRDVQASQEPARIQRAGPMPILDVRVSHDKVVTLLDGRQVSVGGRLPNGARVEDIDLSHLKVRGPDGQQWYVPFEM